MAAALKESAPSQLHTRYSPDRDAQVHGVAFEFACKELAHVGKLDPFTQMVAKRVILLAQPG